MPTVTELRKAGQLGEALVQGLAELSAKPHDVWAKRNIAWVYHDQMKLVVADASPDFVKALVGLIVLELGANEEMLYTNVAWQVVKRLYVLAKIPTAIPGWKIESLDGEEKWFPGVLPTGDSRFRHNTEANQLYGLIGKTGLSKPSEPYSALLKAALHLREKASPLAFLLAAPLANVLRREDYQAEKFQDKKQMPLAEQAYMGLARELIAEAGQHPAEIVAFLSQLDAVIASQPGYQWLPLFKAKLQLSSRDAASALPTLLSIVRQKSQEFWAWNLLAETLEATDPATALACLYRASTCGSEEKFLGKVRLKLAQLLAGTHPGEARWQLEKMRAAYAAEGWPIRGEALALSTQLQNASASPTETARREWLALAEQTAYGDLPWQPAVLQYLSEETAGRSAMAYLLPHGINAKPLPVFLKKYQWLQNIPLGSPIQIRTELIAKAKPTLERIELPSIIERPRRTPNRNAEGAGKSSLQPTSTAQVDPKNIRIVQLASRPNGQLWDTLPTYIAIINGLTADKSLAFFIVRSGLSGAFRPAEFGIHDLTVGAAVQIRLQTRVKDGEAKHFVLAVERSEKMSNERVFRSFSGPLQVSDAGFGFADDVFLPAALITQHGWQPGDIVSGWAVLQHNRRRNKDGWIVTELKG